MKPLRRDTLAECQGRWPGILAALGVDEKALSGKHGPCPMCGGKDRFRFDDKDGKGTFYCTHCGAGDGIKFVQLLRGVDFKPALRMVEELMPNAPVVARAKERSVEEKGSALKRMWAQAKPVSADGPVAKYLEARSIHVRSPMLREAVMPYYDDERKRIGEFPCMVARVASVEGKGVSLHVTYLTTEGAKAEVPSPKKMKSPIGAVIGSAVQLFKVEGDVLGVAEGIETALAAFERSGVPTWATTTAEGMAAFQWPEGVKRLVIFGDNDDSFAGHKAAYTLAFRARAKGLLVDVRLPQEVGTDWNDVLIQSRQNEQRAA